MARFPVERHRGGLSQSRLAGGHLPASVEAVSSNLTRATTYVTTTGNDANTGLTWRQAKATIQSALAALPKPDGTNPAGTVRLGPGVFNVQSMGRVIHPTFTAGSPVVADTTATAGDVGGYYSGQIIPIDGKIIAATPGVSFTLNQNSPSSGSFYGMVYKPGLTLPPGVALLGSGPGGGNQPTAPASPELFSTNLSSTIIQDTGTGVTILAQGDAPEQHGGQAYPFYRTHLADLTVYGNANTNLVGLYNEDQAWFIFAERCTFARHGQCAVMLGENVNSHRFVDCLFMNNGTATATLAVNTTDQLLITGGVLIPGWSGATASAACEFDNCVWADNFGWGLGGGSMATFGVIYGFAVTCIDCQWNHTFHTAAMVGQSGTSIAVGPGNAPGMSILVGCDVEDSDAYTVDTAGNLVMIGCSVGVGTGSGNFAIIQRGGPLLLLNCNVDGPTAAIEHLGGALMWLGCLTDFTTVPWVLLVGNAYSIPAAACVAGSVGTPFSSYPAAPTSVALVSGTPWQNTTGGDVILAVPITFIANGTAAIARGITNTPSALGTVKRVSADQDVLEYYVPAGWYFEVTLSAGTTFTANATAQLT